MITYENEKTYQIFCLSTDKKPKLGKESNGSILVEVDTGKTYLYDYIDSSWDEFEQSGGGGSGGKEYKAGDGIKIVSDTISVDTSKIATVEELSKKSTVKANEGTASEEISKITIDGITYNIVSSLPENIAKLDAAQTFSEKQTFTKGLEANVANAGDFYFDADSIYAKDDSTGEYEPVIGKYLL